VPHGCKPYSRRYPVMVVAYRTTSASSREAAAAACPPLPPSLEVAYVLEGQGYSRSLCSVLAPSFWALFCRRPLSFLRSCALAPDLKPRFCLASLAQK
jgi:hypothetical protein